jgi:phosphatidylinositol glycan class N
MTDYGSHGAGTDDEILTPFVMWGAGVKINPTHQTINQIDLVPLQAALLNIPIPVNSLGVLPLQLLDAQSKYKFQAACANLKQVGIFI